MKKIAILGSTGSIGVSALDVVSKNPERLEVVAMAAGRNIDLLSEQIRRFRPDSSRRWPGDAQAGTADALRGAAACSS